MKYSKLLVILFAITFSSFLGGCGSDSSESTGTGTLSLNLTDAPGDYAAVYVTIDNVQIHKGDEEGEQDGDGEWITLDTEDTLPQTYDLIELTNGVMQNLGITDLETGVYTQLRLYLGGTQSFPDGYEPVGGFLLPTEANYIVVNKDASYEAHALKVPSGYQSGIKLVNEVYIEEGSTVELILDFDANRSVVETGSGKYILKPTIKVINAGYPISGYVYNNAASPSPIAGALVTAQGYDDTVLNVYGTTRTNDDGYYLMYLEPGTYTIVASNLPGYGPECEAGIDVVEGAETNQDFNLTSTAGSGTVTVTVDIDGFDEENDSAMLSFRQESSCDVDGDGNVDEIEVYSIPVVPGDYDVDLPFGTYTLEALATGGQAGSATVVVPDDVSITLDLEPTT